MHIKLLGMTQGIAYFLTSSHPYEEGCSSMEDAFALSTYPVLFHLASPLLKIHNNLDKQTTTKQDNKNQSFEYCTSSCAVPKPEGM